MKNLIIKICLILPLACFTFYIVMAFVGCIASLLNCNSSFYCGPFCLIGKILGSVSVFLFFFSILPDIKALLNIPRYASTKKNQEH